MATSKVILVQKVVKNLARDGSFLNRWVSANSIFPVISVRYQFDTSLTISKATLSRDMGKIDPDIDNQTIKHGTGIYRGLYSHNRW